MWCSAGHHLQLLLLLLLLASVASIDAVATLPAMVEVAANRELAGVNNEWVSPLGLMVAVNRDKRGNPGSWLPPNVLRWVNKSDPFNSASLTRLLGELQLGSYRYPGGSIGNFWNWSSDAFSPLANDSFHDTISRVQAAAFPAGAFGVQRFDEMLQRVGASNILSLDVSTAGPDLSIPGKVVQKLGLARASRFEIGVHTTYMHSYIDIHTYIHWYTTYIHTLRHTSTSCDNNERLSTQRPSIRRCAALIALHAYCTLVQGMRSTTLARGHHRTASPRRRITWRIQSH